MPKSILSGYSVGRCKPNPSFVQDTMTARRSARKLRVTRKMLSLCGLGITVGALPGCQSITGSPVVSQVRVVDASPDAGGLDVYQGSGILAYNLGLGTITSYIPTSAGTSTIRVDAAGTRQMLASQTTTFGLSQQYTVLIGNYLAGIQETVLRDQSQAAPAGQTSVRLVDQSTRAGAVDVYLIPSGSTITQVRPLLTNVVFGQNTGYFNVPAGTYTLAAVATGTVPTSTTTTSYTGSAVVYPSGSARTIILIDQTLITTPGLQVIVADDYDSATQV